MVFEGGAATDCEARLNGQVKANVSSFKYLGSVMSKAGGLEDEMQERVQQGKRVAGTLKTVTRNRVMSMEVKKTLHDSVVIPTLTYGSEAWTMIKSERCGNELSEKHVWSDMDR